MKRFLLTLCALCAATLAWASIYIDENGLEWSYGLNDDGTIKIEKQSYQSAISNTTSGDIVVPSTIDGKIVTTINWFCFYGCNKLTSILLPPSVKEIHQYAFADCTNLKTIEIPSGVTFIQNKAFYNCSSLTSVTIPEGVTSIGEYAFSGCTGLPKDANGVQYESTAKKVLIEVPDSATGEFVIPDSVRFIYDSAFYNCSSLTSVTIPSSVTSIGDNVFPSTVKVSFTGNLIAAKWPAGLDKTLAVSITIPEGVTSIGDRAFSGCSGLTSVTIPEGVTSIGDCAFESCLGLTSVTIPEGVTFIARFAFLACSNLTSLTLPSSLTSIGPAAFEICSGLQTVQMNGPVPTGFADSGLNKYQVTYPKEYGAAYKAILGFSSSYIDVIATAGVTVSAEMTTPQTMKVTYSVASDLSTVKVRAVAFADGVRSFAKIVPVKSGTDVPLGGEVETNTEHTFIWNVSEDWKTDLSKVAIEILVQEGELLSQELITIPAVGDNKAMTITRNTITTSMAFNALLWCIAEGDEALTVSNGVVRANDTQIASGTSVSHDANLLNYLYGKMGYKVLAGDDLTYAKAATRLGLWSSGINQHAIKIEE